MDKKITFSPSELRYLKPLAQQYPTVQDASNQVIQLEAILNLPKGTEHFMSDIHGEHEAFLHILKSSSGEIKEKLHEFFADTLSLQERNELATLIYYPEFKLEMVAAHCHQLGSFKKIQVTRPHFHIIILESLGWSLGINILKVPPVKANAQ